MPGSRKSLVRQQDAREARSGVYPTAVADDDRSVRWHFDGFGRDDRLCVEIELSREQIAELRHLFDRGDDEWMKHAEYPVTPELWPAVRAVIGSIDLSPEVEYFIAATQALPLSAGTQDPARSAV